MPARFFGQFLLEKGVVDREAIFAAAEYQRRGNVPIEMLAVEHKYLSVEQVTWLNRQRQTTGKRFWLLAVEHGHLTKEQVVRLMRSQVEHWELIGEVFVKLGKLTQPRLDELLAEYRKEQGRHDELLLSNIAKAPHRDEVEAAVDQTLKIFTHLTREMVKLSVIEINKPAPVLSAYVFVQRVIGETSFHYALGLPEPIALSIASDMSGVTMTVMDEIVLDAMKEFVNMVVGNACVALNQRLYRVSAEVPKVYRRGTPLPFGSDSVCAVLSSVKGDFEMGLFFK